MKGGKDVEEDPQTKGADPYGQKGSVQRKKGMVRCCYRLANRWTVEDHVVKESGRKLRKWVGKGWETVEVEMMLDAM